MGNRQSPIVLQPLWSVGLAETMHGSWADDDGRTNPCFFEESLLVALRSPAQLFCVAREDGAILWRRDLPKFLGNPILVAGVLLVLHSHTLTALDPKTGETIWEFCPYGTENEWFYSYPVARDGKIFLGDNAGYFNCIDLETGEWIWRVSALGRRSIYAPLVLEDLVCFTSIEKFISAHDLRTGHYRWRRPLDFHHRRLKIFDDCVLVQTEKSLLFFEKNAGGFVRKLVWSGEEIEALFCSEDAIYLVLVNEDDEEEGRLVCVQGYKEAWAIPAKQFTQQLHWNSTLALIYEICIGGFSIVDPVRRKRIGDYVLPGSRGMAPPCYDDGILYALAEDGELFAVHHPGAS